MIDKNGQTAINEPVPLNDKIQKAINELTLMALEKKSLATLVTKCCLFKNSGDISHYDYLFALYRKVYRVRLNREAIDDKIMELLKIIVGI